MREVTFTAGQAEALVKAKHWYKNKTKPYFVLSGYAGTGKTFLINHFIFNELMLDEYDVAFCTPTGKAATVLIQQGMTTARTIHRLIYQPTKIDKEVLVDGQIQIVQELAFIKRESLDSNIKLIVIDEISMVSDKIFSDLLSFNIPIFCTGDDGQLPPVGSSRNNILNNVDAKLTEIVRQADGSSIVEIADKIRKGEYIPYGDYGQVEILDESQLTSEQVKELMQTADQIICGKNSTRHMLNTLYRQHIGINTELNKLPLPGESIIATQNNWNLPLDYDYTYYLVNGMIGTVDKYITPVSKTLGRLDFKADFLEDVKYDILFDKGIFESSDFYHDQGKYISVLDKTADEYVIKPQLVNRFEFAYVISAHKSQGSQFDNVLIFDESQVFGHNKYKWLYTAVTRAKNKVIIIR